MDFSATQLLHAKPADVCGCHRATNSFALPLGTAKTAMIDARDVGEVAAAVLTGEGHAGQAYRLTGPALMDFHEVAARMGAVLERPVSLWRKARRRSVKR